MRRMHSCLIIVLLQCFWSVASAEENARLKIILNEVPIGPAVEAQIHVSWGANIPRVPAGWLHRHDFQRDGGRSRGTIEYTTETRGIDSAVESFIVYGRIIDLDSQEMLRVVPAKMFETKDFESLNQIEIRVTPRKSFDEAILDSYPLEYRRDRGFLNVNNVRSILRSFRLIIEYAGETRSEVSQGVWNRIHTFFQVNRSFFQRGGAEELSEILRYLKSYSAASENPEVAEFYAEFLNGLIGKGRGVVVFEKELLDYLHEQLMQLYETRLSESFEQVDISLRELKGIGEFEKCLSLTEKILRGLDQKLLSELADRQPGNLDSVLRYVTICGQEFYVRNSPDRYVSKMLSEAGARFLVSTDLGLRVVNRYLEVCKELIEMGYLNLDSTGERGEISKFYLAYNMATT